MYPLRGAGDVTDVTAARSEPWPTRASVRANGLVGDRTVPKCQPRVIGHPPDIVEPAC
jgi:hypothetical protein